MERIFGSGRALLFGPARTAATNVANATMSRPIGMRVPTSSHYPSFRTENPIESVDRVDRRPHHQTEIQCACPSADQELRLDRRSFGNGFKPSDFHPARYVYSFCVPRGIAAA